MSDEAYTIREFCAAFKISKPTYFRLRAEGRGPKETRLGAKVLVMRKDVDAWIERQQNLTGKQAKEQEAINKRLVANANAAVKRREVA